METTAPIPGEQQSTIKVKSEDRPKRSESIGKLAAALAKAQGEMENAEKDVKGNFGKYATLAATWDAIRKPLSKNEIAIYQRPLQVSGQLKMCTMLIHASGEFIDDGELEMIFDRTGGRITPMQAMGSAVTYSRRYTLQAAVGVAPADDDDGAGAGKPAQQQTNAKPKITPAPEKTAEKKPPQNMAPAPQESIDLMYGLAIDRQVKESELNYLLREGYGVKENIPKLWIVNEVIKLLENEDTNSIKVLAAAQGVISRREAKRILDEQKQNGGEA